MSWGSLRFSGIRQSLPGSGLAPIWIDSGAQTRPWEPWEARRWCLREGLPLFLQQAPGRPFEGFDVIDVDEAPPDLHRSLVLEVPECPGHSLPIGPDHGAKVLMGVAGGYANLPWDLHPLALHEEEDEASKPCWHLFEGHVLHTGLVVVQALREEAYHPDAHPRLLLYQALHRGTLHHEYDGGLGSSGVGLPQTVGGEGHLPEDRTCIHHVEGELSSALCSVEAHPALLEDEELAALFPRSIERFAFPKTDVGVLTDEDPYLLVGERVEEIHLRE